MASAAFTAGETAAEEARRHLGVGLESPLADVLRLVEQEGEVPVTVAEFPREVAGLIVRRPEHAFIFVNGIHPVVRQRFTLAHEYGHYVLGHQSRVDETAQVFGSPDDAQEVEANYFAGSFLAPRQAVRNWMDRHAERPLDLELVVRLGHFFGISAMSAAIRMENSGCVDESQADELKSLIDLKQHHGIAPRLGLKPVSDELQAIHEASALPRLPVRMNLAVERAIAFELIDEEEARELLHGRLPEEIQDPDEVPF